MKLYLPRTTFTNKSTIGDLYLDNVWHCFTLEDVVRDGPKIPGQTAIPARIYDITIDWSNRFKRRMPHILDVPDFVGVRLHKGDTAEDTEGCILVGAAKAQDYIGDCSWVFDRLFDRLDIALQANEHVSIEIVNV